MCERVCQRERGGSLVGTRVGDILKERSEEKRREGGVLEREKGREE